MSYKMSESIMRTVISNEFEKYAEEHSHEWKELASEYAVEMLVKIRDILNENISLDDCYKYSFYP